MKNRNPKYATEQEIDHEIEKCKNTICLFKSEIRNEELMLEYLTAIKEFMKNSIYPYISLDLSNVVEIERFALPLIDKSKLRRKKYAI